MRNLIVRIFRIQEEPASIPPPVEKFRASRRLLAWRRITWGMNQVGAGVGLLISLVLLRSFGDAAVALIEEAARAHMAGMDRILTFLGMSIVDVLNIVEAFAVVTFPLQLLVTGTLLRLDWELRWYQINDTTLRIREGVFRQREQTITVANIQNMVIRQGPIQRVLGIADLEIHTAGGGRASTEDEGDKHSKGLHVGRVLGVDNAEALRNRLRAAQARQRGAGLGDPDEPEPPIAFDGAVEDESLERAVNRLFGEVYALRQYRERLAMPGFPFGDNE